MNFTGAEFTVAMVILAGVGAVLSFMVFNKMIKKYQKTPLDTLT